MMADLIGPWMVALQHTWLYAAALLFFAAYPIVTSIMWITTSLIFLGRWEKGDDPDAPPTEAPPRVTVLIPAHNESSVIAGTLAAAARSTTRTTRSSSSTTVRATTPRPRCGA
jgi:cellulose synthase/poly-beta-1,6-N-acetylglucosamine synthase-like glycosyltransferase